MKNSLFRNLAIFLVSIMLVLVTHALRPSQAANDTGREQKNKYLEVLEGGKFDMKKECAKPGDENITSQGTNEIKVKKVDEIIQKYHEVINCLFNKRITVLTEKMKLKELKDPGDKNYKPLTQKELEEIYKLLSPPPQILDSNSKLPTGREDCKPVGDTLSLSTYCLATYAVDEYFQFREAMIAAREKEKEGAVAQFTKVTGKSPDEAQPGKVFYEQRNLFGAIGDVFQGEKALQDYGATINKIDREIDLARQALDQALAAYNEMQIALPMHMKYREVIKSLEKYRDGVKDVRKKIDLYPASFLDVTTPACT